MMKFRKLIAYSLLTLLIIISVFGLRPCQQNIDAEKTLVKQAEVYATEIRRLPDASYLVAVRTPMPEVKVDMLRWWFSDFMQTTEHYSWWHPEDHIWMDWENKEPGKIIGASHLVHEYIGGDLLKLRIQFVNPFEFFSYDPNDEDTFVICARVGLLDKEINIAKMCHVVRNTLNGAEMRSRFWLGRNHFSKIYGINNWTDEFFDELNGVCVQFGQSKDKVCYELIAPIDNKSPVYNVLLNKKNILNHIAYIVDEITVCSEELLSNKFVPLGEPNKAVAYSLKRVQFFYSKEFGYILELIEAPNFYHDYNPQNPT